VPEQRLSRLDPSFLDACDAAIHISIAGRRAISLTDSVTSPSSGSEFSAVTCQNNMQFKPFVLDLDLTIIYTRIREYLTVHAKISADGSDSYIPVTQGTAEQVDFSEL
jgi:hypothetical protein